MKTELFQKFPIYPGNSLAKTLLVMKLTIFLTFLGCIHASAHAYSQTVSLSENGTSLSVIFKKIERQTGYGFSFNNAWMAQTTLVTINVKDVSIKEALDICFKNQPFLYSVVENIIVVKEKTFPENKTPAPIIIPLLTGKVTNDKGEPLAGASIYIKNSSRGTSTNDKGIFELTNIPVDIVLEISYSGYATRQVQVHDETPISLMLHVSNSALDQVQIIAYGTTTQRLSTGNTTTITSKEIEKSPVNNPLLALQGRVPGLFISQDKGFAGGSVQVRIQGQNSIASGNEPLYVVDGVPYTSQMVPTALNGFVVGTSGSANTGASAGNPLNYINPSDIESIGVLKDADATAIYGSRAANGAILINTKKGKAGKYTFDVNLQTGFGKVPHKVKLLNTKQYLSMRNEAVNNDGLTPDPNYDFDLTAYDTTRYTDWQKTLIGGIGKFNDAQLLLTGGNSNLQYLVGGGYHEESTVFPGNFNDKKGSLHFNINNVSPNQKFHFQLTGNNVLDYNQLPLDNDLTFLAMTLPPDSPPLYNKDGSLNWAQNANGVSTWTNPIAFTKNRHDNTTVNIVTNSNISYEILNGLQFATSVGYNYLHSKEFGIYPLVSFAPEIRPYLNRATLFGNNTISSWIVEPQIKYNHDFGESKVDFLIGSSIQETHLDGESLLGVGFNSDAVLKDIGSAANIRNAGTISSDYRYNALFTRLNYSFKNRYSVSISSRRDGSSRFGAGNQFHDFSAIGANWIFSEESVIKSNIPVLSFGKIKASYGTTGNDQIGDYKFLNLYSPPIGINVPFQGVTSLTAAGLPNSNLQWEETKKINVGLDIGFLKDRILFTGDYAINRSSNQLINYTLPITTGFQTILKNIDATIQNVSWELSLSTVNFKSDKFSWSSNFNMTIPKNKLVKFDGIENTGYGSSLEIGQSINLIKAYRIGGVDPVTGLYSFFSADGKNTLAPDYFADRTQLVNPDPTFYGGFQNTLSYKGLSLSILFQFVKQRGINYKYGAFLPGLIYTNQPTTILNRWQKNGDVAGIQKYNSDYSAANSYSYATQSDQAYGDASYVRLKNFSVSWDFSKSLLKRLDLAKARVYIQGQNLITITKYIGLDPETKSSSTLPPLRVITFGLEIGL